MCNSFTICNRSTLENMLKVLCDGQAEYIPDSNETDEVVYPGMIAPVIVSCIDGIDHHKNENGQAEEVHDESYNSNISACPSSKKPCAQNQSVSLKVEAFEFGLPVEWKKGTIFNARFDSLVNALKEGEGIWGNALAERRCILPCETFFESHRSKTIKSPNTGRPIKQRHSFMSSDGCALFLGAVYKGNHFSVVTTEPNAYIASIHDRMPLVLTAEEARDWLDPTTPLERITQFADRSAIPLSAQPTVVSSFPEQMRLDL